MGASSALLAVALVSAISAMAAHVGMRVCVGEAWRNPRCVQVPKCSYNKWAFFIALKTTSRCLLKFYLMKYLLSSGYIYIYAV